MNKIIEIDQLTKRYELSGGDYIDALKGIDLHLIKGETLGLVGESGSGKSTLAKILMKLEALNSGRILLKERDSQLYKPKEYFSHIQMVFQDPYSSLNPRKTIFSIITEPLVINKSLTQEELRRIAKDKIELVGLNSQVLERYPHTLSGGQRQRVGIARALTLEPEVLILDEPISALDVSIQAAILNLLIDLQKKLNLTYLFIGHDLNVIRYIADRVAVMYLGEIVEMGSTDDIFKNTKHEYTKKLINSSLDLKNDN
ncbi:MAG: peptide ABC transporter ATP-binding protein [Halobacteriovoraceae bacterium]|nr:peptide ABC transporter ATP-binding protein [Halobacteriovoraceae bacterium]|tara:strand:- start:66035 stop:66805 length:771 start_codon:yes stop_codon:yes gene_type:complete